MRVAIVGYGLEGQNSAAYWANLGNEITVCDQNINLSIDNPAYKLKLGPEYLANLDQFDLIVRTAGLHPKKILDANVDSPKIKNKITSSVNEFLHQCPSTNVIGVTGTKGKGTTSTLITKMLEAGGKTVHLGGNIGVPALELLPKVQPTDWVVLELSSFQLSDVTKSTPTAVCLMVVPEHLDWHTDFLEYVRAKQNLFRYQTAGNIAIYNALSEGSEQVASISVGKKLAYDVPPSGQVLQFKDAAYADEQTIYFASQPICQVSEVALLGRHNLENICAAISAVWAHLGGNIEAIKSVIISFSGLEHRIELVREIDGVRYYNDSFATTPETAIACLQAFPNESKVIILGGSDKGVSFEHLAEEVARDNVRHAILIGDTAPVIESLLRSRGFTNITTSLTDMTSIVTTARVAAQPGDVVLLSTGCASFGLFKDYKDRGNQFKNTVQLLA